MSNKQLIPNEDIVQSLINLRDELSAEAFDQDGYAKNTALATAVWKINSCLYRGYKLPVKESENV